jgi:hypothetical protein
MRAKRILVGGAVLLGAWLIYVVIDRHRIRGEYQEQLRLARAEGIPTSAAEYAAIIRKAVPGENAAPFYRQLKGKVGNSKPVDLETSLIENPDNKSQQAATVFLAQNRGTYAIIDEAAALPRCWFDRDWSQGAAVLMPEYAYMKAAGRWLGLRGSLAAVEGRQTDALADAARMMKIAEHCAEEGNSFSQLVRQTLYQIAIRDLATWASMYRDQPGYRKALAEAIGRYPKFNVRQAYRGDFYMMMDLIELSLTPAGRAKIGLRPGQESSFERIVPLFVDREMAKVQIVKGERKLWKALATEPRESKDYDAIEFAREHRNHALLAFPTAADVYNKLFDMESEDFTPTITWMARKQFYTALLRAVEGSEVPKSIRVSDLLGPYDRKPLKYRFDGKEITIEVAGEHDEVGDQTTHAVPVYRGKVLGPRERS